MNTLFEIEPQYPTKFCRTCTHRVAQRYPHGTKFMQFCELTNDNRNQFGMKRIKVTNPACNLYEPKNKEK